jgi:hypothetical protein
MVSGFLTIVEITSNDQRVLVQRRDFHLRKMDICDPGFQKAAVELNIRHFSNIYFKVRVSYLPLPGYARN